MNQPQQQTTEKKSRLSAVVVRKDPQVGWIYGVVAKRIYRIVGADCRIAEDQQALVEEPVLEENGDFVRDSDLILNRSKSDVIVEGKIHSMVSVGQLTARVRIGSFDKPIVVYGDRQLYEDSMGNLQFSSPKPFVEMPIDWTTSYGGVDLAAIEEIGDPTMEFAKEMGAEPTEQDSIFAYPRNPRGKGYIIERTPLAIERCSLPNLEMPQEQLTPDSIVLEDFFRWPLAVRPVGLSWLPYNFFPRSAMLTMPPMPYDEESITPDQIHEIRNGDLKVNSLNTERSPQQRLDIRATQSAAMGMRIDEISPVEEFSFTHFHPINREWTWRLPGEVPRMAFQVPGAPAAELVPQIKQILVQPDTDTVSVIWAAQTKLQTPFTEEQLNNLKHGVVWSR